MFGRDQSPVTTATWKKGVNRRGSNNPRAVLSVNEVKYIRKCTHKAKYLAWIFKVHPRHINAIRARRYWKDV